VSLAWAVLEPVFASLARDARTAEQLSDATHMGIAVGAVEIIATVLAIRVVREIDRRQRLFD
jgi:hypothetical protein